MRFNIECGDEVYMGLSVDEVIGMYRGDGLLPSLKGLCGAGCRVSLVYATLVELFECMRIGVEMTRSGCDYELHHLPGINESYSIERAT